MEGKLKVALKHFESAVKMNPDDHLNWYKRATAYIIDKKYEAALKDLGKVLFSLARSLARARALSLALSRSLSLTHTSTYK